MTLLEPFLENLVFAEVLLLLSSILVVYAIARRIVLTLQKRERTPEETFSQALDSTWAQFRHDGMQGAEIILLALLIPDTVVLIYYLLLVLPLPAFRANLELRSEIIRPTIFTANIIEAMYFLNGRLTRSMRTVVVAWNKYFHTS